MAASVAFYQALGFELHYGGPGEPFSSLRCGAGYLNLQAHDGPIPVAWGRYIVHVPDPDHCHAVALACGFDVRTPVRDAEWGERYFHLGDPDGHEVSLAREL